MKKTSGTFVCEKKQSGGLKLWAKKGY